MKKLITLTVFCLALFGFTLQASAQGGGGRGRGMMASRLAIMARGGEALQKELGLSEEQVEKIGALAEEMRGGGGPPDPEAMADMEKEAVAMLDEKQSSRLTGIFAQVAGFAALTDEKVATAIGLTGDDLNKVKEAVEKASEDMQGKMQELFQSGDRAAMREKMTELREEANKTVFALLSEDQTKKLEALKGEKFEMPQGRGPGGGGGGGKAGDKGGGKGGDKGGKGGGKSDF